MFIRVRCGGGWGGGGAMEGEGAEVAQRGLKALHVLCNFNSVLLTSRYIFRSRVYPKPYTLIMFINIYL